MGGPSRFARFAGGSPVGAQRSTRGAIGNGQGPRSVREGRQAVRGPAQEGDEQAARGLDRQLSGRLVEGRQEERQGKRRVEIPEARRRPRGRQEVELSGRSWI